LVSHALPNADDEAYIAVVTVKNIVSQGFSFVEQGWQCYNKARSA
jgi:hypothetical protein